MKRLNHLGKVYFWCRGREGMSELGQFNRGGFDMGRMLGLTGPQVLSLVLPI